MYTGAHMTAITLDRLETQNNAGAHLSNNSQVDVKGPSPRRRRGSEGASYHGAKNGTNSPGYAHARNVAATFRVGRDEGKVV